MLQRNHSSPSFREPDPATQRPSGASKTVDPEYAGLGAEGGRMGEHDPPEREGPYVQAVGRVTTADDTDKNYAGVATGARTPHEGVTNPAQGGATIMSEVTPSSDRSQPVEQTRADLEIRRRSRKAKQPTTPVAPDHFARDELLYGHAGSTIAAGNYRGVLEERMKLVADPGRASDGSREPSSLARKMMKGQMVRFESQEEKAAVENEAKRIAERWASNVARWKKVSANDVQPSPRGHTLAPVPEGIRTKILDTLVTGKYDPDEVFERGEQKYKQPVLNTIAKTILKNGSYLSQDAERLLKKVQSLLPAAQPQRAGKQTQKAT